MSGITMIELMVVLVVVAILASLAVPSYRDYVLRANRSEGIDALLDSAACLERYFTKYNTYQATNPDAGALCRANNTATDNGYYSVNAAFSGTNNIQFDLTASPQGNQADDSCGNLTLDESGVRGASSASTDPEIDRCWRGKKI